MFKEPENHLIVFTIYIVIGVFLLCFIFLALGYMLQRRLLRNHRELEGLIETHNVTIMQVEVQTKQDTLAKVGAELARTVGRKLTQVEGKLTSSLPLINQENIQVAKAAARTLTEAVEELRDTSRSMSSEIVRHYGLKRAIEIELDQLIKYKIFSTDFQFGGEPIFLKPYDELLVFRIIQESVKNAVKHSEGSKIKVFVKFATNCLFVMIEDDGIGYPTNVKPEIGKGLHDIHQRVRMLNGSYEFLKSDGALFKLSVPLTEENILLEPIIRPEIIIITTEA
ncbi:MAG: ATP-binding protein [Ferruginibacter sp.]|nr:ATP-binding protein [Ferruginibacter sp.]